MHGGQDPRVVADPVGGCGGSVLGGGGGGGQTGRIRGLGAGVLVQALGGGGVEGLDTRGGVPRRLWGTEGGGDRSNGCWGNSEGDGCGGGLGKGFDTTLYIKIGRLVTTHREGGRGGPACSAGRRAGTGPPPPHHQPLVNFPHLKEVGGSPWAG